MHRAGIQALVASLEQLKKSFGYDNPLAIVDLKSIFLNCAAILGKVNAQIHPKYNIGIIHFEEASFMGICN